MNLISFCHSFRNFKPWKFNTTTGSEFESFDSDFGLSENYFRKLSNAYVVF